MGSARNSATELQRIMQPTACSRQWRETWVGSFFLIFTLHHPLVLRKLDMLVYSFTIPASSPFKKDFRRVYVVLFTQIDWIGWIVGVCMVMFMFLICSQKQSIEMRRETVIRSLILYLGEKQEELFEDCLV